MNMVNTAAEKKAARAEARTAGGGQFAGAGSAVGGA